MLNRTTKLGLFSRTFTQLARFSTPYLDAHLDIAHGQFTAISTLCSQPLNAGQLSAALMVSRMSTLLAEGQAFVLSLPAPVPFTRQHPPYVALDKIAQLNWDTFQASYNDLRDPDQVWAPEIPDVPGYANFLDDRLPSFLSSGK